MNPFGFLLMPRRFQVTRAPFFVVTDDAKPEEGILMHTIYDAEIIYDLYLLGSWK